MFKNQNGFSLLQTLVGIGLTGVLALILMKNQESTGMMKSKNESDMIVSQATNIIQKALSDRATCSLTLNGKETGGEITEIIHAQPSATDYNNFLPTGVIAVKTGLEMAGGVAVKKMTLINDAGNDFLEVDFDLDPKKRKKMTGPKEITKRFQLMVTRTGTLIENCHSETANLIQTSSIESCRAINGTMINGKCQFIDQLVDTSSANCGEGASYKTEVVNGKIKLTCTPCTVTKKFIRSDCEKKVNGVNWLNICYYRSGCSNDSNLAYGVQFWEIGGSSASGGDTGTKNNCFDKRHKCAGE